MFWIAHKYRTILAAAAADSYDAVLKLRPQDHFVEKQGRSTGRYAISGRDGRLSVYLKKYFRLPWWQRLFGSAKRFPGPLELANLQRVAALGIAVPEPVVAGAERGSACKSLLALRELEGFVSLHQFIPARLTGPDTPEQRAMRRVLTERLADVARRLHAADLYHRDLYLCHFFIRETPGAADGFDLVLIDFTRLIQSRLARWRVKDLAQFLFSSDLPGITRTDRLRFFKQYLRVGKLDSSARRLLRRIQRKAARYQRHNANLLANSVQFVGIN